MLQITSLFKKALLVTLILGLGLAVLPITGARAAGSDDPATPPAGQRENEKLENAWSRVQHGYQRQGDLLGKADGLIAKVQSLIDKANSKGWDTSAVQSALDAFKSAVQNAAGVHAGGSAIIASHAGFDASGKVVDRTQAMQTVQSLRQVLKDTRSAMNGTGKALREAIKAFRAAHRPAPASATP
jgi:hypothetical protein